MNEMVNDLRKWRLLGCASQGSGGDDEARLCQLLAAFSVEFIPFTKTDKKKSFLACLRRLKAGNFDLFVLEGTGIAGGLAAILGKLLYGRPYVLSSGDAVGPFLTRMFPLGAPIFQLYEWMLYRCSSGFIGWTPYLVGRALTMGAKRGVTIPGWPPFVSTKAELYQRRLDIRARLGIPESAIVFGIAGALVWSNRVGYCYGSEMIRALLQSGSEAYVLIVGDGSGLERLRSMAGEALNKTIFLTGRVPRNEVPGYLAAMDIGSLPQSVDGVGSFRYSTKISEYHSVGLPFFTNETPMAYDLDRNNIWRLPGDSPWSPEFISALATMMGQVTRVDIRLRTATRDESTDFDRELQIRRVTAFLNDILHVTQRLRKPQRAGL